MVVKLPPIRYKSYGKEVEPKKMNEEQRKKLVREIKKLDPEGEVVKVNLNKNRIRYSEEIKQHRKISALKKKDGTWKNHEFVRAYCVVKLVKDLEYPVESLELEKGPYYIGRPKQGASVDIAVNKNEKPYMFFEIRDPDEYDDLMKIGIKDQLFGPAKQEDARSEHLKYLIYYTASASTRKINEKFQSINYEKFRSYKEWAKSGRPNLGTIPFRFGEAEPRLLIKGGERDLRTDVSSEALNELAKEIHQVLWSGGKYEGHQVFDFVMKLILTKIYDERNTIEGEPYKFQLFYEDETSESAKSILQRIQPEFRESLQSYLNYSEEDAKKVHIEMKEKLKFLVSLFQEISFIKNDYELLGDFFERVIRRGFKESKGKYFTHSNLVDFILYGCELEKLTQNLINEERRLPYIIDPACGSGKFLTNAIGLVTDFIENHKAGLKKTESVKEYVQSMFPDRWVNSYIYGIEISEILATASKVNMVAHGGKSANIEPKDAFAGFEIYSNKLNEKKKSDVYPKPVNEEFDVVVSNPPFIITTSADEVDSLDIPNNFVWGGIISENLSKRKSKEDTSVDVEHLFIERWYQLLRPGGRMGVVLPVTVLNATDRRFVRLFLFKYFWIKAIVELPELAFKPHTSTKTCLLFAQKKKPKEVKDWEDLWQKYEDKYGDLREEIDNILEKIGEIPVDAIGGIGDKSREKLEKAKVKTVETFANLSVDEMSEILSLLKERARNFLKKARGLLEARKEAEKRLIPLLQQLLGKEFDDRDVLLAPDELKDKYGVELQELDRDWWIFSKVSKEIDYQIFMASVKEIGYKKGRRKEERRPNELFRKDEDGYLKIDTQSPATILDHMRRKVKW